MTNNSKKDYTKSPRKSIDGKSINKRIDYINNDYEERSILPTHESDALISKLEALKKKKGR